MKTLSIVFLLVGLFTNISKQSYSNKAIENDKVLEILSTKCNVCHSTKNPSKVFTKDNMDAFYKNINRQVFVFKRMPKGNKIKLSTEEKEILKDWINTLKN